MPRAPDPDSAAVDPAIRTLRQTPLLSGLGDAEVARLLAVARRRTVHQGIRLIAEGAPAEDLYFVLRGRFSVRVGGRPIADIGAGEPIGEIAFFAGGLRSADVVATRRSEVISLDRTAWDGLARDMPGMGQAVMAALARRLAVTSRYAPPIRPLAPRCVGLRGDLPPAVRAGLLAALPDWEVIASGVADPRDRLSRAEGAGRKVLVLDPADDLLGDMDELYDIVPLAASPEPSGPLPAEAVTRLVLWRDSASQVISGTARWLKVRPCARHHHLALDAPEDIARLARFIDGRALGLVLSGGGAQGTAHLGALKAFGESGLTFDMVGGTSAGAAMGAALALGRDPDMVMSLCEEIFLRSRAMGRYTLPRYSVLDPAPFDAALRQHFGNWAIEDLPIPYFALATNLSTNDVALLDRGPLWEAVRASTSIPVVFPPWITESGEILVDGAMIDNAPIQAMRARKPGPAILLNMLRDTEWRSAAPYGALPGRLGLLIQVLVTAIRRGVAPEGLPTAVAVLSRVFNVNAQRRLRAVDAPGDVMFDIQPLAGMAFLDWTKSRAQFEASYRIFAAGLAEARTRGHDPQDPVALLEATKRALSGDALP